LGFVRVKGLIGRSAEELREVEFLIDTGSRYTLLPPDLARSLDITPAVTTKAVLADSRTVELAVGVACLRLLDREGAILVGILQVPVPILGVMALETLGLKVDPVNGKLEYAWPFGPAAL
jgi:clan AA aspartic protease